MITLVALSFSDDVPSLHARSAAQVSDAFAFAIRALGDASAFDAPEAADDAFPLPSFRSDRPPGIPHDSRRFRFTDDPDEWRN